jgi:hypothetical protein
MPQRIGWGMIRGLLLVPVIGLLVGTTPPPQAAVKPNQEAKDIVGYVVDLSKSNWIMLANEVGVAVDKHTKYELQTPKGLRKASLADVVVGKQLRITLGEKGVAKRVLILQPRQEARRRTYRPLTSRLL